MFCSVVKGQRPKLSECGVREGLADANGITRPTIEMASSLTQACFTANVVIDAGFRPNMGYHTKHTETVSRLISAQLLVTADQPCLESSPAFSERARRM